MTRNLADSRYFFERIQRTAHHAVEYGESGVRMSDPLVLRWVVTLIRQAFGEGNPEILKAVSGSYGRRLPLAWRALAAVGGMLPRSLDVLVHRILFERLGLRRSRDTKARVDVLIPPSMSAQTERKM